MMGTACSNSPKDATCIHTDFAPHSLSIICLSIINSLSANFAESHIIIGRRIDKTKDSIYPIECNR